MELRLVFFLLLIAHCNYVVLTRRIILRSVNLDTKHLDTWDSNWENTGFERVSRKSGETEANASVPILMASKPAKLVTFLDDVNSDFLFINFTFMIGKTIDSNVRSHPHVLASSEKDKLVPLPATIPDGQSHLHPDSLRSSPSMTLTNTSSINPSPAAIIQISFNPSNPNLKTEIRKLARKKRELDSNDILQIRQMIDSANTAKGPKEMHVENLTQENKTMESANLNLNTKTDPPEVKQTVENKNQESIGPANSYLNWKNAVVSPISKNIRPPGFYFSIDDQVVFDNWGGVWNHVRNVMGKVNSHPELQISNQTNILYTLENTGSSSSRKVRVNFEWEPPDSSTHLFLDDISISTYSPNPNEQTNINHNHKSSNPAQENPSNANASGNQNITIYVIFKPDSNGVETKTTFSTTTATMTSPRTESWTSDEELKKNETQLQSQPPKKESNHNNAFIVLAALGCSFFVILLFLLWIKMNGGKKCGRIPC